MIKNPENDEKILHGITLDDDDSDHTSPGFFFR
jgi:hypothetical protein